MVWWPLGFAGLLPPSSYSEMERREMLNSTIWKIDQLPERVGLLRQMLLNVTSEK